VKREKAYEFAKKLRKNSTEAEKLVWRYLRGRRFLGMKFRRQQPIGNYVVDFVCFEKNIIIEVDGGQHAEERNRDRSRDLRLTNEGFRVLRFWNNEVIENIEGVLELIKKSIWPPSP
jgi:very-short-patch-repair endonuclease